MALEYNVNATKVQEYLVIKQMGKYYIRYILNLLLQYLVKNSAYDKMQISFINLMKKYKIFLIERVLECTFERM